MEELRYIAPTSGGGIRRGILWEGIERGPMFIGCDAGFPDDGPYQPGGGQAGVRGRRASAIR
jgi:hypothetical protein